MQRPTTRGETIVLLIAGLALSWFIVSRLGFAPVPWPDGSAFYLPGVELWSWPPRWRMESQAAFVPEYHSTNFNTLPLLPAELGLLHRLGLSDLIGGVLVTRLWSMLALFFCVWESWRLVARNRRSAGGVAFIIAMAVLWDPVHRWGTQVVRTETWVMFAWFWILGWLYRLQDRRSEPRILWRLSFGLALAAYNHFEAIILVPGVIVALWPWNEGEQPLSKMATEWALRNWGVFWRTLLLLSPWLLYCLGHFESFRSQMETQFHRLAHGNGYFKDPYSIFHNLFISHGSPASWPKFFNLGKAVFWALLLTLLARLVSLLAGRDTRRQIGPVAAAATVFVASYFLWYQKPEVWFTTLCHFALWGWAAVQLRLDPRRRLTLGLAGLYAVLSVGATVGQFMAIPQQYNWVAYQDWIDCIDRTIRLNTSAATSAKQIWQPHVPDALIELKVRHPEYALTRALDFPSHEALAWEYAEQADAVIFSRHYPVPLKEGVAPSYEGAEREEDREQMKDPVEVPYGQWGTERLPQSQPGAWSGEFVRAALFGRISLSGHVEIAALG